MKYDKENMNLLSIFLQILLWNCFGLSFYNMNNQTNKLHDVNTWHFAQETELMKEHARLICHNKGSVLNVGHGMGIVDRAIQVRNWHFDVTFIFKATVTDGIEMTIYGS